MPVIHHRINFDDWTEIEFFFKFHMKKMAGKQKEIVTSPSE